MEPFSPFRSLARRASVPRGFTLVEMLVVLAIIIMITAIVINGQSTYNRSILLTDTAYTVAYSIRQAQSLGLASRGTTVGASIVSNAGYGVRFAGSSSYVVFADTGGTVNLPAAVCPVGVAGTPDFKRGNCKYDTGTDRIVKNYTFSRGYTIANICGKSGSVLTCSLSALDVVFMRPETRAILIGPSNQSFSCAEVHVRPPTGSEVRIVRISQLGEISVGQTCP